MDTALFQGDNWLYFPGSEALVSERLLSLSLRARAWGNRIVPRGPASAAGSYRRCANDGRARDTEGGKSRERERRREKANEKKRDGEEEKNELERRRRRERERKSVPRARVTHGVERRVTQVQSSAPACPRALLAQQRQEAAERQWLQQRHVELDHKQTRRRDT